MNRQKGFGFVSLVLLLIFLGSKSLQYHAFSHADEDGTACEWCAYTLLLEQTPFDAVPESTPDLTFVSRIPSQPEFSYREVPLRLNLTFRNFSRPPPLSA